MTSLRGGPQVTTGILLQDECMYVTTGKLHLKGNAKQRCQVLQHVQVPHQVTYSKSGLEASAWMVHGAKSPLGALRQVVPRETKTSLAKRETIGGPHTIKQEPSKPTAITPIINSFALTTKMVRFYTIWNLWPHALAL